MTIISWYCKSICVKFCYGVVCRKRAPSIVGRFLATQVTFLAKFWGYSWELAGVFGINVPVALLIDP